MEASQRNVKLCQQIFQRKYPRENLKEAIFFNAESSAKKMDTVKKLDNFLKDLLKEDQNEQNEQNLENVFEKL